MARRKRHRHQPKPPALHEPSRWRLQHGDFTPPVREADPETGLTVLRRRAIDTLGLMLSRGTIRPAMQAAGEAFRGAFRAAAFNRLRATPLIRVPAATRETLTERTATAREHVARAMDALGGPASPAGSAIWHMVGCELSILEWDARQGWGGRPVGHVQAQGILVAALGVLARHYRL